MFRFKTGRFRVRHFRIRGEKLKWIVSVGAASSLNQAAMMVMNLVLNSTLLYYGVLSVYGGSEALAAAGVVTKVNFLFYSTVIGCGIIGVLCAGPGADVLAAVVSFFVLRREFRSMWREAELRDTELRDT